MDEVLIVSFAYDKARHNIHNLLFYLYYLTIFT